MVDDDEVADVVDVGVDGDEILDDTRERRDSRRSFCS